MEVSKKTIIILCTAIVIAISISACSKRVSTTETEGTKKPDEAAASKQSPPPAVYETIAEPPVPQPDTLDEHISRGDSGDALNTPKNGTSKGIRDLYFDFDSYLIRDDAKEALNHNSVILKGKILKKVVIEGHADERGTTDYNLALGERRAKSARKYLTTLGIDSSKISVITFGKEKPFCSDHNEDCWQQNRRAHFVLGEQ